MNVLLDIPANEAQLTISAVNGKLVQSQKLTGINPLAIRTLDVSSLTQGVYMVRIAHVSGVTNTKLVIE